MNTFGASLMEAKRFLRSEVGEGLAATTEEARQLDGYRYENFHGFFFFLSTVVFIGIWVAIYKYYNKAGTSPSNGLPPNNYISRFSSRQPPPPRQIVVVTQPQYQQQYQAGAKGPSTQNPSFQAPLAAYAVDDFGRRSMIPSAIAIPIPTSKAGF